ncbi:hypothetical protein [Bradyrhizobium sp.]|uniref:hypothetical protein n=1 Tax=Bradyrhizobium sp. TaxID=376 RepID=UPI001D1B360B|nr:hypothetical protein [Bradyrhizobium sp.]MBI5323099.1 hypothetical protein [Bradyrhizobium sp.]
MFKFVARLLPLLLLFHLFSSGADAQQPVPGLNLGDAVVTGFAGTIAPDPGKPRPANKSAIDLTFINPDGPAARIVGVGRPGYVWDGRLFQAPKTFDVFAKDTGQVFGVALDDQPATNIYLAASSAFGLNLVGRGADGLPERRKVGGPGTGWMKGQFGLDLQGDPGSIYRVDGTTGAVTLFAKVMLDGVPNPGPALGNLAHDAAHKQLFVSDLYTGMIHRFALADGSEPGAPFDHGVTGRSAANLAPMPFNPANRPNIANNKFNAENPDSWGFAPPERRVWGLAVQAGRLFYSVRNGAAAEGPQIWSVGIAQDGSLAADARLEVEVAAQPGPYPVSDIAFSQRGALILAQRAPIAASHDYSAFTKPGEPRVLRYWLKDANDPPSPGLWKPMPEEYAVGFAGTYRNTDGGVALGYGYRQDGTLDSASCEASLWTTAQNLRNNPALRSQLEPGGPLLVNGLQGSPADMVRGANEPPAISYFVDYDDKFDDARASGHIGSVRILTRPCTAIAGNTSSPPYVSGQQTGGGGGGGGGGGNACYPPNQPTSFSLPPQALPPCTQPGQAVSLDLSTVLSSPGFDPNWAVTPYGPLAHSTAYGGWTTLSTRWIQPKPFVLTQTHPVGTYVYTRAFNLTCRPESYKGLKLCGQYGSDNSSVVTLNAPANIVATSPSSYSTPAVFFCVPTSFFVPGLNVLTVTVQNASPANPGPGAMNPTGMSMIANLEAICGPDCICECPPGTVNKDGTCVPVTPIDLKIGKETTPGGGGGHWFNVWVTNVGPPITFPAGGITITENIPAGMTVTGVTGAGWSCVPPTLVGPGTMHCTYGPAGSLATNASLSSTMVVHYTTTGPGPFTNCATVGIGSSSGVDTNPANDTACATVTETAGNIDLAVVKTGGTSPVPQVNGYAFHLAVTSVGAPFNGTNVVTVTDVVPAGMTFNSATGTNWTCVTLPASAGSTITCTYIGAGPTVPNQSLGTIDIVATALGAAPFPPFTNCAQVGTKPGSGLSDVNPPNDKSCVTVTKPVAGCPPPMVPGPVAGQCICPPPTHLVGNKCEGPPPPPSCQPPMVPGPVAGQCICLPPTVQKGKECVRPMECRSPLIPNASGTGCGCPAGLEQRGRECVKPTVCNPPAKLNRRGACECPTDMVARGNSCIERERPRPQVTPGDVIRIPGGGRDEPRGGRDNDNPRGGRDTDSPRGGGQGPMDFPGRR